MSQCSFASTSYVASATAIISGIQVEATKPATTGASESTSTSGASSSTDSATGGAGKMAVSIIAAAGTGLIFMLQL
jgi:hypothetical protein